MAAYEVNEKDKDVETVCIPHTGINISNTTATNQSYDFVVIGGNISSGVSGLDEKQHITEDSPYSTIEHVLYSRVIVVICVFGLLGNMMNLIVLTRQRMRHRLDRMEKSAHMGLIALAVSDMLFCATLIPHAWVPKSVFYFNSRGFSLYYTLYGEVFINTFIICSTWLTVVMAFSRYVAICHPLNARSVIGCQVVKVAVSLVFLFSIILNIPRFWYEDIDHMDCVGGWTVYFRSLGHLKRKLWLDSLYLCLYFSFSTVLPVILLTFCNVHLIRTLNQSQQLRRRFSLEMSINESTQRITLTLIIIILMNVLLVAPAEVINFLKKLVISNQVMTPHYNLGVVVVNTLVSVNFAFNFILYCAVNAQFRRTLRGWFCRREETRVVLLNYGSVTMATHLHTKNDSRKCSTV